jgi:CPA1 family monovalent cation:H+ antiporter
MSTGFNQFDAIFNIIIIVTVITLAARRLRFPPTIALIFAGLLATFMPRLTLLDLGPEVFVSLLLPPILFQETLHLDVDGLIDDSDVILSYAVAGTLIMITTVAVFVYFYAGLDVFESFLLGIIVAPTDPVAVIRTFKNIGVIKRFQLLVAGESLFNDGVSIVVYSILLSIVTNGSLVALDVVQIGLIQVVGGAVLGITAGFTVHILFCWIDDKFTEVLVSFIAAFGVFRLAEELGTSGVIATVLAGLLINYRCRNYGGLGGESREMLDALWEFVGFLASSIAFVFIGMNLDPSVLVKHLVPILFLTGFILVARLIIVMVIAEVIERYSGKRIPRNWRLGIFWSGLRGAVSVVLVLGIGGLSLPNGEMMTALTFGVVLTSNLLQGLTMSKVARRLNLFSPFETQESEGISQD